MVQARQAFTTVFWATMAVLVITSGCTRRFYRNQADRSAFALIKEKAVDPRWPIANFHVYPDPRSRFADWTNWDRPPMPPDDPPAKILSPNPQRPWIAGVDYIEGTGYISMLAEWDKENRVVLEERNKKKRESAEAIKEYYRSKDKSGVSQEEKLIGPAGPIPPVIDALERYELQNELAEPVGRSGSLPPSIQPPPAKVKPYLITINQSVELAIVNSREYQTACEQLYLAALPLTLERFAFAAQFFALEQALYQTAGAKTTGGPQNNWAFNTLGGFSKVFSTGALLLTQFANQTVINLGSLTPGAPRTTSQSTINLDLVQPFLRGGGRAVTLEPLTQAERDLLYSVRDFFRFRQGFYTFIAVGQAAFIVGQGAGVTALPPGTVSAAGAFIPGPSPLVGGLAAPAVPVQVPPGAGGRVSVIPPFGANPQGYLATLLQKAQLVTSVKNVNSLQYFLRIFSVWEKGGLVNPIQTGTVEQNLLGQQGIEGMLTNWVQYRQALDLFRIQLGLPTPFPLELDDGPLQPMYDLVYRYEDNSTAYSLAVNQAGQFGQYDEADKLRGRLKELVTNAPLVRGLPYQTETPAQWAEWEKLKPAALGKKLRQLKQAQDELFFRKNELEAKGKPLSDKEAKRLDEITFQVDLGDFEKLLREYDAQPWKGIKDPAKRRKAQESLFIVVHQRFAPLLTPAARQRLQEISRSWPTLPPVNVGEVDLLAADDDTALNTVVRVALENRVDLMNQRAQLVDSWRKVRVTANALMGTFNVEYNMNSTTPPGLATPFAFSENRTRHEVIFNAQLPIVRMAERNNYRSALIAYQQARRNWMDAQDQIAFAVRFQLRNLRISAYNYIRVQRRKMELAYLQVDQALQAFNQPAAPQGTSGGQVSPPGGAPQQGDPAALTNQLLNVQGSLVGAQNDLYSQWLGYLQNRINLYRDMGLMPLDPRGIWIEDVTYPPNERPGNGQPFGGDIEHHPESDELLPPAQMLTPTTVPPVEG
jgi:hypothetical protein